VPASRRRQGAAENILELNERQRERMAGIVDQVFAKGAVGLIGAVDSLLRSRLNGSRPAAVVRTLASAVGVEGELLALAEVFGNDLNCRAFSPKPGGESKVAVTGAGMDFKGGLGKGRADGVDLEEHPLGPSPAGGCGHVGQ